RRRHTRFSRDWSSDVCSSDLQPGRLVRDGVFDEGFFGGEHRLEAEVFDPERERIQMLTAQVAGGGCFTDLAHQFGDARGASQPSSEESRVGEGGRAGMARSYD